VLRAARVGVAAALLALLELGVRSGIVNGYLVAPPSLVARSLIELLATPDFRGLIGATLLETAVASGVAAVSGMLLGYALWRRPLLRRAYEPTLVALFSSPLILLYPIFLVLFGRGIWAVITLSTLYGVVPVALFTLEGLAGVRPALLRAGVSLRLSRAELFRHIQLPAAAPTIFTGVRLGLAYVLVSVVATEFVAQIGGLGNFVAATALRFQTSATYAGIAMVMVTAVSFIAITRGLERRLAR
jgi:ABC-type nitrate/sulfonate/bicarbonate transport system permease component